MDEPFLPESEDESDHMSLHSEHESEEAAEEIITEGTFSPESFIWVKMAKRNG